MLARMMPAPAFLDDGRGLVTITGPSQLTVWDVDTGRPGPGGPINTRMKSLWGIVAAPDGSLLAATGTQEAPWASSSSV